MEYSFSGILSNISVDVDRESRNLNDETFGNIPEMMNLEGYSGWCNSPLATEQLLASYGFDPLSALPSNHNSYDQLNFSEQESDTFPLTSDNVDSLNVIGNPINYTQLDENDSRAKQNNILSLPQGRVPRPVSHSLPEKMLHALSLFKESSGGGFLAQMWVPIRSGDQNILSTCDQPYLLDQVLSGYREVSRSYTFSAEEKPGSFPGLPGRVFISKIPEWTSNVSYYSPQEYLRVQHALDHEVRGSVGIPIFNSSDASCCAVLELVTKKEKLDFDSEIESVCRALEVVDLRTTPPLRLPPQHFSESRMTALSEITDVLRVVCHAHRLPLALTWIPCTLEDGDGENVISIQTKESDINLNEKSILCIEETTCYVNDKEMQGFVHACSEHPLKGGQGVAGKAFQSNIPFYYSDVKNYHINEYPLVQHARKHELCAAVAIRLRSTYTGNDDYILELFLPTNMKGNKEQQLLLDSLSGTMQRICKNLRTVGEAEVVSYPHTKIARDGMTQRLFSSDEPSITTQELFAHTKSIGGEQMLLNLSNVHVNPSIHVNPTIHVKPIERWSPEHEQASGSRRSKKRNTTEKTVGLSVLQQYFPGSLKDAAKSIGVCPTTLKRICRQHGISRWPSRKINKVNRSLKKIQTVLDSVEGVEGGLKFDPSTGELVASGSVIQEYDASRNIFLPKSSDLSRKDEVFSLVPTISNCGISPVNLKTTTSYFIGNDAKTFDTSRDSVEELITKSAFEVDKVGSEIGSIFDHLGSPYMTCRVATDDFDMGLENEDGTIEHHQISSSSMTESSNASGSSTSPHSCHKLTRFKEINNNEDGASRITIKVRYMEDTIRFKFDKSFGCLRLYEEVATRFRIPLGSFQLKYLDDEEEWVMLVSDSDLQECLEIMEFIGKHSVKFLVRDMPCSMGSSGGSSYFLSGS
ncbi:hypothetical protein KSS87_021039 [Heliosperma pusillum]|nr:hypothetical protein KSS87_021039 [Heliosperma pusillum]